MIHPKLSKMMRMWYLLAVFAASLINLCAVNIRPDESPTSGSTASNRMQIFPIYSSGDHASDYFSTVTSSSSNAAVASSSATISHDLKTEPLRKFNPPNVPSSDSSINLSGTTIKYAVPESTFQTSMDNTSACANAASRKSTTNPSPNLSTFVESFTGVVLSTPALQRFLDHRISAAELKEIIYVLDRQLFQDYGLSAPEDRACEVSQAAALQDGFTLPAYFRIVGYTIGRFLATENVGIGPGIPQCYASSLENALLSYHIDSNYVLYQALLDAFVNFVKAIGFDLGEYIDFLTSLFTIELITFVNN